jgi:hypothetical protein
MDLPELCGLAAIFLQIGVEDSLELGVLILCRACDGRRVQCGHGNGERAASGNLFRSRLDQIIDMKHPLVRVARRG